jgi:RNA polymerase sigma factor for flagellar operon FliA
MSLVRAYASQAPARDPARDRLIAEHVDMARRIAVRVGRRVPSWLREDDLVGAAMIGLAEAAERFDPSFGQPFVGFAEKRIRGAVLDELRRGDLMPRRVRATARKVGETIRRLEQALGRPPEDEEIARALGVPVEEYRDEMELLTHVTCVDLDSLGEVGPANDNAGPAADAERRQLVNHLRAALDSLPERDATLLSLYYVEELSYSEVGEVLGVSESRVCQLHSRALARLRAHFDGGEEE